MVMQAARETIGHLSSSEEMAVAVAGSVTATPRSHSGLSADSPSRVDWSGFGAVLPVLAASPGVGSSTVATVLADAVQLAGRRTLLVDPTDSASCGLTWAASSTGPVRSVLDSRVWLRCSWRAQAAVMRVETTLPVLAPEMVPPPAWWRPPVGLSPQVTIADLGHDSWRWSAHPLSGAGEWLRQGYPVPRPIVVVRASRPSLRSAEQVLRWLDRWVDAELMPAASQLVVTGVKRWPRGVLEAAGPRVAALLPQAVLLPPSDLVARRGVTASLMPPRLRQAVAPLLHRWGLDTPGPVSQP